MLSTEVYPGIDTNIAMYIGSKGIDKFDKIGRADFDETFAILGLNAKNTMADIKNYFANITGIAEKTKSELPANPVYGKIIKIIQKRFTALFGAQS
jgi:hypothetical protein